MPTPLSCLPSLAILIDAASRLRQRLHGLVEFVDLGPSLPAGVGRRGSPSAFGMTSANGTMTAGPLSPTWAVPVRAFRQSTWESCSEERES